MIQSKKCQSIKIITGLITPLLLIGSLSYQKSAWGEVPNHKLIAQNFAKITATSAQETTLYLNNDRSYSYNLIAQERGVIGNITIPKGATIVGKYVPAEGGLRYVAEAVTYDGYSYSIRATSGIIEDVKDPRDTSAGAIATDAGIGAAGGTILGEIFGDAGVGEIVGGAAAV